MESLNYDSRGGRGAMEREREREEEKRNAPQSSADTRATFLYFFSSPLVCP